MENLNHLYTFYVIAQSKGLTLASDHLKITPSAVSHSLKSLEEILGIRLMERGKNFASLTDAGTQLFEACQTMFNTYENVRGKIKTHSDTINGKLTVGASVNLGAFFLPKHTGILREKYPDLFINLHLADFSSDLLNSLELFKTDLILMDELSLENRTPRIAVTKGVSNHFIMVASPNYLERSPKLKKLEDINRHIYIDWDSDMPTLRYIKKNKSTMSPKHLIEANNHVAKRNIVIAGIGIGVFPKYSIQNELDKGILKQVLPNIAVGERKIVICYHKRREDSKKLRLVRDYLEAALVKEL